MRDADVAQQVERILGKDEVTGSNPVISSINRLADASRVFVARIGVEGCAAMAARPCFYVTRMTSSAGNTILSVF